MAEDDNEALDPNDDAPDGQPNPARPWERTMPDGTVTSVADIQAGSMYSAIVIDPRSTLGTDQLELFGVGRGQAMLNGRVATAAHTNVPRSGYNGLPMGWEGLVAGWRARLSCTRNDVIDAWAASIAVRFTYCERTRFEGTLLDLLDKEPTQVLSPETGALRGDQAAIDAMTARLGASPIRMRDNLSYKVTLDPTERKPVEDLRDYLQHAFEPCDFDTELALARLDATSQFVAGAAHSEIQKAMQLIRGEPSTFTLWVFLDGLWTKTVY